MAAMPRSAPSHQPPHGRRLALSLAATVGAALLLGCATPAPPIDIRHIASGQDSRVQFVVLHFTNETLADSLRILSTQQVSAHYLVGDQPAPTIYRLVDEDRRAWHAGESAWQGQTALNASSIGIEIVNPGRQTLADGGSAFAPYPAVQIDAVIALLQGIVARHGIRPDRIVGHSDIAPQRKDDPGPAFPWQRLAQAGLIAWPDAAQVAALRAQHQAAPPGIAWVQARLACIGYAVPDTGQLDAATRRVVRAFQMRYRPGQYDGTPDAETTALIQAVLQAMLQAVPGLAGLPPGAVPSRLSGGAC